MPENPEIIQDELNQDETSPEETTTEETTPEEEAPKITYDGIRRRVNGSYQINKNGMPYHIPNKQCFLDEGKTEEESTAAYAEWKDLWEGVDAYAAEHPDEVTIETPPAPPTLDELKEWKLSTLEAAFETRVSGSFECSQGYPMQFNRSDCVAVQGAVELLKATGGAAGYLTDANDVTHYDVPLATVQAVLVEMLGAYSQCHSHKQELRAQITAAEDEAALDAVIIAWPI